MKTRVQTLQNLYGAVVTVIGVLWITSVPQYLELTVVTAEVIGVMLGLAVAAALLRHPYRAETGLLELFLGAVAIDCWLWMALHYTDWLLTMGERTPDKWVPGIIAIVLTLEALRKTCGLPITS